LGATGAGATIFAAGAMAGAAVLATVFFGAVFFMAVFYFLFNVMAANHRYNDQRLLGISRSRTNLTTWKTWRMGRIPSGREKRDLLPEGHGPKCDPFFRGQ
jgi:hypothetical protein